VFVYCIAYKKVNVKVALIGLVEKRHIKH